MADPKKIAEELSPEAADLVRRLTAALAWAYPLVVDCGDYLGHKPARAALGEGYAVLANLPKQPMFPTAPMSNDDLCEVYAAVYRAMRANEDRRRTR